MTTIEKISGTRWHNGQWLVRWQDRGQRRWQIFEDLHAAKRHLVNQGVVKRQRDIRVTTEPVNFSGGW